MGKFVHCSQPPLKRKHSNSARADAMAEEIRAGVPAREVADKFGVTVQAVWRAAARRQIFTKGRGANNEVSQ